MEISNAEMANQIRKNLAESEVKTIIFPPWRCFVCNEDFQEGQKYREMGFKIGTIQLAIHEEPCYQKEIRK